MDMLLVRRAFVAIAACAVLVAASPLSSAAPSAVSFAAMPVLPPMAGFRMEQPFIGDVNGDGKADLVVQAGSESDYRASVLVVLIGRGNGTFMPVAGSPFALPDSIRIRALVDTNRDGVLDFVAEGTGIDAYMLRTLLGSGDGTFHTEPSLVSPVDRAVYVRSVTDCDGDGIADALLFGNPADEYTVVLMRGRGDGTFTLGIATAIPQSLQAIGDFNHDGRCDLVLLATDGGMLPNNGINIFLQTFLQESDGTFHAGPQSSTQYVAYPFGSYYTFAVADFDQDSNPDVALIGSNFRRILRGRGDGTFVNISAPTDGGSGGISFFSGTARINADTLPDLIVCVQASTDPRSSRYCRILLGSAGGALGGGMGEVSLPDGQVALGDVNGDGGADLISAPGGHMQGVTLYLNTDTSRPSAPTVPGMVPNAQPAPRATVPPPTVGSMPPRRAAAPAQGTASIPPARDAPPTVPTQAAPLAPTPNPLPARR